MIDILGDNILISGFNFLFVANAVVSACSEVHVHFYAESIIPTLSIEEEICIHSDVTINGILVSVITTCKGS